MKISLNKSDWYLITLFFVIAIPVTLSFYDADEWPYEAILDTIVYCLSTSIVSYIIVFKFFPFYFPQKKILTLFFWTALVMVVVGMVEILAYNAIAGAFSEILEIIKKKPGKVMFWAISTSAENSGILIGILLGKKFYESQLDIQQREKEKKENELRLLKSQIDPHFLFNNLNTVDSLIDTDPIIAKKYLRKLASLYRYLIRTKDDEVVLLEEEIEFAKNYIFLLEQRFGQAYQFEIEMNSNEGLIPPGALQTLIENVVKHNVGSAEEPIVTTIIIDEEKITVTNPQKSKAHRKSTTKTGLSNLKARFQLLSDKDIKIINDEHFTVVIPTLKEIA